MNSGSRRSCDQAPASDHGDASGHSKKEASFSEGILDNSIFCLDSVQSFKCCSKVYENNLQFSICLHIHYCGWI